MTICIRAALLATLAVAAFGPPASAQSLTTLYARNNGGSFGGAVYFDVQVTNPGGIWVTSFDTNTFETVALTLDVYTVPTTHAGNETNPSAWTLVSSGVGIGQGANNPTPVDVADFVLAPGAHGVALVMSSNAGHDYTNGSGSNQTYSNADMQIQCGTASNVPFTGTIFSPRVWNGTIYYSGAGNNVPTYGVYGEGCQGSNGRTPSLTGTEPRVANPFTINVGNLPPASVSPFGIIAFGFSKTGWGGGPLPYDLSLIGAPNCSLLADPLTTVTAPNAGASLAFQMRIPNVPSILFGRIYNQAFVVDPNANGAGVTVSNGGEGTIGS